VTTWGQPGGDVSQMRDELRMLGGPRGFEMSLTTIVARAIWAASNQEDRAQLVDLARQGDALVRAQGGAALQYPAANLTPTSSGDQVVQWVEGYNAAHERTAGTMPLSILWAGAAAYDPRADPIVSRLYDLFTRGPGVAPVWATVLDRVRPAPQAVRMLCDWWAARGPQLQQGDQQDKARDDMQRGWWWTYAQTLRQVRETDPAVGSYPTTPPPGTTPPGTTPPGTTPPAPAGGLGTGAMVGIAAAVLYALSRRKGRR